MKAVIFIFSIILSFSSFAENEEWRIRTTDTMCSIHSYESVDINETQLVHFNISIGISSKDHEIPSSLRKIGLKPNEFSLQMIVSIHKQAHTLAEQPVNFFGADTEIKEPLQILVNDKALISDKTEYGIFYYLSGDQVKKYLDDMESGKPFQFQVQSKSIGKSNLIQVTDKRFMLNYYLLKSCAAYFV